MKKQVLIVSLTLLSTAAVAAGPASSVAATTGFYGGVTMRDAGAEMPGLQLGTLPLSWNRFRAPVAEDTVQRAVLFGGYRWKSDIAVEASLNTGDRYSLQPRLGGPGGGMGLVTTDPAAHTWNADVYTSWEFVRSVSLYGRLGYAQTETRPLFAGASLVPGDVRRQRDGVNYGLGLRYDMNQSLGLRLEYSRFGRYAVDNAVAGPMPESDQVMIGVQFRF
ncbi:MAG: outer membrane beta-barrel protein [Casimicrobiaceae bacterium]